MRAGGARAAERRATRSDLARAAAATSTGTGAAGSYRRRRLPKTARRGDAPWGFYRDRQGRVMQVSFDFGRRLWLGVGYAPRRTPDRRHRDLAGGVRLRRQLRRAVGRRPHAPALHRARRPGAAALVRARRHRVPLRPVAPLPASAAAHHDLRQGAGAPRSVPEHRSLHRGAALRGRAARHRGRAVADDRAPRRRRWICGSRRTCARTCALRVGPGVEMRFGPWGDETRYVGILPQATLEGNVILGHRAMQRLNFRLRGDCCAPPPGTRAAARRLDGDRRRRVRGDPDRDQRSAGVAALRGQRVPARRHARRSSPALPEARVWGWTGTAGIRMAFFSPPVPPAFRK